MTKNKENKQQHPLNFMPKNLRFVNIETIQ